MKVLSFGSLNIDYTYKVDHFVQKGETLSSDGLQVFSGGKGLNQSVALAKAGAEVYHAGAVGEEGQFLIDLLNHAGVNTDFVRKRSDIQTGHAIIQNDKTGDNCILLFGGANQAISREQIDETLEAFDTGDLLVLQNEINELSYLMEKAHQKGMKIALNPSPMDEKIFHLPLETVDYLLLNEGEAMALLGMEKTDTYDGEVLAKSIAKKLPQACIFLTMGELGSMCFHQGEITYQNAFHVNAVDTTAAGDTYTGYVLAGILDGKGVAKSMYQASKASAIAVTRKGAAPSIPDKETVCATEI